MEEKVKETRVRESQWAGWKKTWYDNNKVEKTTKEDFWDANIKINTVDNRQWKKSTV